MVGYKHPVLRTPLHWRGISHVDGCGVVVVLSKALPQRALSFAQRARSLGVVVVCCGWCLDCFVPRNDERVVWLWWGYNHPVLRTPLHWRGISHVDGCGVVVVGFF